jgi:hypothetical protein
LRFWGTRISDFCVPVVYGIFVGLFVGDVEDYKKSVCAAVVGAGDGTEALVAGGVPYLQFYLVAVEGERLEAEVYSNCG